MAEQSIRTVRVDGFDVGTTDQGAQAIEKLQRQIADMSTAITQKDGSLAAIRDAHASEISSIRADHQKALDSKAGEVAAMASQQSGTVDALKSEHQKALDALTGEVAALKAKMPDATQMDALIAARAGIIDAARKILGDKFDPSGKADSVIRKEAVSKRLGATAVADKSDDYICAAFDTLTAVGAGPIQGRDPVRDSFVQQPSNRARVTSQDSDDAYEGYVERLRSGWQGSNREAV